MRRGALKTLTYMIGIMRVSSFVFGGREDHQINPAQGGAEESVRLLLAKT